MKTEPGPPMTLGNAARERQSEDGFAGESTVYIQRFLTTRVIVGSSASSVR